MALDPISLLSNAESSVQVRVTPLDDARLCWSSDNSFTQDDATDVAVRISASGSQIAWADRYGGHGIGGNGGAGRAGLVGRHYLKGIGATPLIGRTADIFHSSGGAYLEEAVREAIFAEIFSAELPWGAVRTTAIIDTLQDQIWDADPNSDSPVPRERRVLIVREPRLRPAHFMRASHFTGEQENCGWHDTQRVRRHFDAVEQASGAGNFAKRLRRFWFRWTEQCAYQFVARLTQGPPTPSNVDMDGRLMDFGAATSLPDWSSAVVVPGEAEFGYEFGRLASYISDFYAEHRDREITGGADWKAYSGQLLTDCESRYYWAVGIEMLRLAGLRRETIEAKVASLPKRARLAKAAERAVSRYLRIFRSTIEHSSETSHWDFSSFWRDSVPTHLAALRAIADDIIVGVHDEPVIERFRVRCQPRDRLYRESIRRRLHAALPPATEHTPVNAEAIRILIQTEILNGRRDSRYEPKRAHLCGFAAVDCAIFALFRNSVGDEFAIEERPSEAECDPVPIPFIKGKIGCRNAESTHLF